MLFLCCHRCHTLWLRELFPDFLKSIYIVLDIICSAMSNSQIKFFSKSGSDIFNEVICCCSKMTFTFTESLRENSLPFTCLIIQSPIITFSFFTAELFCRLSFKQVIIIVGFMYCWFIVLFIRGGLFIHLSISDSINSND